MDTNKILEYKNMFHDELFNNCLEFWLNYGIDKEYGGVNSFLDKDGKCYSNIKSVWVQGRFMWLLSYLCSTYGKNEKWIEAAKSCGEFLDKYCFDKDKRMYFQVTREGVPVRKRRYYFSEAFYIMAYAQFYKVSGDEEYIKKARSVYEMVLSIYNDPSMDPHKVYPKIEPAFRKTRAMGGPMIMLNVTNTMRLCDEQNKDVYDKAAREYVDDIIKYFYKPELKCLLENVSIDGSVMEDLPMGRVVNPGHAIEAAWFMFNEGKYLKDDEVIKKALNILEWSLEIGWDKEYGGIVYFKDICGYPPEQYEHDMKLWWPQCEAIIATLMAYEITGDKVWSNWFEKITEYSFKYLKDNEGLEWTGYLHKDNTKQLPLNKGNSFKGPFHLPRMLIECEKILDCILKNK